MSYLLMCLYLGVLGSRCQLLPNDISGIWLVDEKNTTAIFCRLMGDDGAFRTTDEEDSVDLLASLQQPTSDIGKYLICQTTETRTYLGKTVTGTLMSFRTDDPTVQVQSSERVNYPCDSSIDTIHWLNSWAHERGQYIAQRIGQTVSVVNKKYAVFDGAVIAILAILCLSVCLMLVFSIRKCWMGTHISSAIVLPITPNSKDLVSTEHATDSLLYRTRHASDGRQATR